MRWRRPELWLAFVLWLVTAAAYLPTLGHDFVPIDDPQYVSENGRLASGLTREGLVRAFTERYFENWTPLTTLSYAVDYRLHGLWAGGYLLTNLLLHATAASLLFLALVRMTGALGRSGFVAGLFALHPLHVEAVAWVAERKEVLSGVFLQRRCGATRATPRIEAAHGYGAVALCLAFGLLAKPMLVTVPFVLLLLDLWPLGRVPGNARAAAAAVARLTLEKIPLFFLSAVSSVITFRVQEAAGTIQTMEQVPLVLRLVNIPLAYAWYLEKTFWPVGLGFYYPLLRGSLSPLERRPHGGCARSYHFVYGRTAPARALSARGLALVFGHARAGDRARAGWLAGLCGSVQLSPPHRHRTRRCVGCARFRCPVPHPGCPAQRRGSRTPGASAGRNRTSDSRVAGWHHTRPARTEHHRPDFNRAHSPRDHSLRQGARP